jgi:hypothetical protein
MPAGGYFTRIEPTADRLGAPPGQQVAEKASNLKLEVKT